MEMEPAPWLEPARRQARILVTDQLARPRRPLPLLRASRTPLVVALLLIVTVPSAWAAWRMRHVETRSMSVETAAPVVRTVSTHTVVRPTVPVAAVRPKSRKQSTDVVPAPTQSIELDEPLGEVIEVKRAATLPPLFDVGEYKSRGVMVK